MPALPAPIGWIVVASALIDASAFLAVLLGPREIPYAGSGLRRITAFAALRAFFVTGLIFAAKLVVLVPAGLNPFGVIHLLYVDMVVVVPVLAAGLLLAQAARRCRLAGPVAWGAVLGLFLIPVGVYASRIEPYRLRTEALSTGTLVGTGGRAAAAHRRAERSSDQWSDRLRANGRRSVARSRARRHPDSRRCLSGVRRSV